MECQFKCPCHIPDEKGNTWLTHPDIEPCGECISDKCQLVLDDLARNGTTWEMEFGDDGTTSLVGELSKEQVEKLFK